MAYNDGSFASLQTDGDFAALVRSAFAQAGDRNLLGRHPLAQQPLVASALILDTETPSMAERGWALFHTLFWAVERIAPDAAMGTAVSHSHATAIAAATATANTIATQGTPFIQERHWARYNLLRFYYLQPEAVLPDEKGISALGITSPEAFYEERSRAFAEAVQWLVRQRDQRIGDERIRTLALEHALAPLQEQKNALHLLGIASLFSAPVARATLLAMAEGEQVASSAEALNWLLAHRYLHAGAEGTTVAISAPLREHLAQRQPRILQQGRHQAAARHAQEAGNPVAAAWHLVEGGSPQQAATTLLNASTVADADAFVSLARRLSAGEVGAVEWRGLQMVRAEIAQERGQPDEAMSIWRELLKSARTATEQADLYLRMGRLVTRRGTERSNDQAMAIFQMGLDRLTGESAASAASAADVAPMRAEILKEVAWLQIQAQDWRNADETLHKALALLPNNERSVRAELYDALSTLRRNQNQYADAIEHALAALVLREGLGDSMRLGRSYNSLGILYRITEEFENAIQAYQKALAIFQRLDNAALVATTMLNIGTAHHFTERLEEAERWYRRCLQLADEAGLSVTEVRAHANLFEALTALGREDEARLHWRSAWARSRQLGFADEIAYLQQVAERDPHLLQEMEEDARLQSGERTSSGLAATTESAALDEHTSDARESAPNPRTPAENGATHTAPTIDAWMAASPIVQGNVPGESNESISKGKTPAVETAAFDRHGAHASSAQLTSAHTSDAQDVHQQTSPRLQFGAALDPGEAQMLELLNHLETINVATAMEATGASKATATRKLAHLVEKGLLIRHGQGRATYYSRAHGIPAVVVAGDLAGLQNRLDRVALCFSQEYNLVRARAVGVRYGFRPDGDAEVCYEVRASFTRNPLLEDFFELERSLSRATGSRIQLTL